jgi:hypothetical protein
VRLLMDRRHFVGVCVGGTLVIGLSPSFWGCGSDDEPGEPSLIFTSSVEAGHTHELVLRIDEIEDPPTAGLNRATSEASGHTHIIILTVDDLERLGNGETVTRETTEAGAHSHTFTLRRP